MAPKMTALVKNSSNDGWSGSVSRSFSNILLVPVLSSVASPRPKRDTEAGIKKQVACKLRKKQVSKQQQLNYIFYGNKEGKSFWWVSSVHYVKKTRKTLRWFNYFQKNPKLGKSAKEWRKNWEANTGIRQRKLRQESKKQNKLTYCN